jgi:hypothetical protein
MTTPPAVKLSQSAKTTLVRSNMALAGDYRNINTDDMVLTLASLINSTNLGG